jgi:hypothetical protein
MQMKYLIAIIFASVLLTSCFTKKKAIEKFCKQDTTVLVIHDTIRTETIRADTFFSAKLDTFIVTKDRLTIRYKKVNDTIYLSGECLGDSIIIERVIKVPHIIPKESIIKWWWLLVAALFGGALLRLFFK